jgi:hypothetical protein
MYVRVWLSVVLDRPSDVWRRCNVCGVVCLYYTIASTALASQIAGAEGGARSV